MQRLVLFIIIVLPVLLTTSCKYSKVPDECDFTGTWIKGHNVGDTLVFFTQDGENLVRYKTNNPNPNALAYDAVPYTCRNEALYVAFYLATPQAPEYVEAKGFKWVVPGQSFSIEVNPTTPFIFDSPVSAIYIRQ